MSQVLSFAATARHHWMGLISATCRCAHTSAHTEMLSYMCIHKRTGAAACDVHASTMFVRAMKSTNQSTSLLASVTAKPGSEKGSKLWLPVVEIKLKKEWFYWSSAQINADSVLWGFVCALRSSRISAAPSELGEDQRHPGAEQSPAAGGADGLWGWGHHGPLGTTAPLAQPPRGQSCCIITHKHTHTQFLLFQNLLSHSASSTVLTPCHQKKKKKKTHPGCCVTPGEAANCGLFTVSCPPGAWSLEPWLKRIQPLLQSARHTHSSGWNCIDTKRQAHIDTKWYKHSVIMQGEKKQEKLVVLADKI